MKFNRKLNGYWKCVGHLLRIFYHDIIIIFGDQILRFLKITNKVLFCSEFMHIVFRMQSRSWYTSTKLTTLNNLALTYTWNKRCQPFDKLWESYMPFSFTLKKTRHLAQSFNWSLELMSITFRNSLASWTSRIICIVCIVRYILNFYISGSFKLSPK